MSAEYHSLYRTIVGKLRYMVPERIDAAFDIGVVSRDLAAPTGERWTKLKRLVRFVMATADQGLNMTVDPDAPTDIIECWTDTDHGADTKTRRSVGCAALRWCGVLLSFQSKQQSVVATSSGEAEFYGIGAGLVQALGVRSLLEELDVTATIRCFCDASAGRAVAGRSGLSQRTKHVAIKYLWVQEVARSGLCRLVACSTKDNHADLGTKALSRDRLEMLSRGLGMD